MICQNCGFQNDGTPKFCMKCGNAMVGQSMQQPIQDVQLTQNTNFQQQPAQPNNNFESATNKFMNSGQVQSQPIQNPTTTEFITQNIQQTQNVEPTQNYQSQATGSLNYIFFILAVLLKPITSIKEELHKFNDTKTSIIFALIISGATTVINLIKTIFSVVYVPASSGYFGYGETEAHWAWNNLKSFKWGEVIFKNFLLYVGILVAIALVYYLASLIIKKQASFKRLLGIATISIIPMVICGFVVSPLIAKLYAPLGVIVSVIGAVYTILLLIDGANRELTFEDNDAKIYANLVCLSILGSAGYYAFMKFFFTAIDGLDSLLDLFS